MAGLAAAGSARAMGAIVRGFDTRYGKEYLIVFNIFVPSFSSILDKPVICVTLDMYHLQRQLSKLLFVNTFIGCFLIMNNSPDSLTAVNLVHMET